jgi:hypothetical protein
MPTGRPAALVVPLGLGALTSLALGLYAGLHEPTGRGYVFVDADGVDDVKWALTAVVVSLVVVQVVLGALLARPGGGDGRTTAEVHRLVGTLAFACSIPVAFHCLWSLGYRGDDLRVAAHSVLGCVAYGCFVAKVIAVRRREAPMVVLAALGSVLGVVLVAIAATGGVL